MLLQKKIKDYFYWLSSIITAVFAIAKVISIPSAFYPFYIPALTHELSCLGVIELAGVLFFLLRPAMPIGFSLLCVFLGSAIGVSIVLKLPTYLPISIFCLFGLSVYWRAPELFQTIVRNQKNINNL